MVKFDDRGLVPAIVQNIDDDSVLTLAYMNKQALQKTLKGPDAWFYSRSRRELWHKGETSGHFMKIVSLTYDCDGDALLLRVKPTGPACHSGDDTCFHNQVDPTAGRESFDPGPGVLEEIITIIQKRKDSGSNESYTTSLLEAGRSRIAQKVIEEAGELALSSVSEETQSIVQEAADLLYHVLLLLSASDVSSECVWEELRRRRR